MVVTAEGIEQQVQLDLVREIGIDQVQGYLFGRPVPAHNLNFVMLEEKGLSIATASCEGVDSSRTRSPEIAAN